MWVESAWVMLNFLNLLRQHVLCQWSSSASAWQTRGLCATGGDTGLVTFFLYDATCGQWWWFAFYVLFGIIPASVVEKLAILFDLPGKPGTERQRQNTQIIRSIVWCIAILAHWINRAWRPLSWLSALSMVLSHGLCWQETGAKGEFRLGPCSGSSPS